MTLKKRGLGRGLEALLADVPAKDDRIPSGVQMDPGTRAMQGGQVEEPRTLLLDFQTDPKQLPQISINTSVIDDQAEIALTLIKNIQRERMSLLEEAEILRKLISEFESMLSNGLL
ncbi:MAG: hypothetical protein ACXWTS_00820 [Methylococcaceae bacterium]